MRFLGALSTRRLYRTGTVVTSCILIAMAMAFLVLEPDQVHEIVNRNFVEFTSENADRNRNLPSRSSWIIPTMAPTRHILHPPDAWSVFVPTEFRTSFENCNSCHSENTRKLTNLLSQVTGAEATKSERTIKMARLLFLLKHNATGILHTSDHASVKKSVERLIHDDQPYGIYGLEYYGENLTMDSSQYLFYSGTNYTKPCQYHIQYKMKALWTVGVRCRSFTDKENGQILIDPHSPPLFSSTPKFTIETFSDSFFAYEGFWAMFATLFSSGEDSRVWSLWAQRMLQEVEGQMAIVPLPCARNKMTTQSKIEPDSVSKEVFKFIEKWKCETEKFFFDCSKRLVSDLLKSGYVKTDDVTFHDLWLNGIRKLGYPEPVRISKTTRKKYFVNYCVLHTPALITPTSVTPKKENMFPNLYNVCTHQIPPPPGVINPFDSYAITKPAKTADIAIVILFNHQKYYSSNMPFLYDMYYQYFPNIIVCGPNYTHFGIFQQTFRKPVSFIEVQDLHAFIAQECVTRAMMINFDVRGYIEMSDDNLLNSWNIGDLPRDKFWFQKQVLKKSRQAEIINDFFLGRPWPFWTRWGGKYGKKGVKDTWTKFDLIKKENNPIAKEMVETFFETLHKNTGNWDDIYYQASDVFYVPARIRRQWIFLADNFNAHNVFLEIAVPTLIYGLDTFNNVFKMEGNYLWYDQRRRYRRFYRFTHHFQHSWKLSRLEDKNDARFLCYDVLGEIVKERTLLNYTTRSTL